MDLGLTKRGERTRCKSGEHAWIPANWYVVPATGHKWCRLCHEKKQQARDRTAVGTRAPTPTQAPPYSSEHAHFARHCYPTRAEPEAPVPPLVLFGPWSPPALGER